MTSGSDGGMSAGTRRVVGGVLLVVGVGIALVGLLSVAIDDRAMDSFADRHLPGAIRGLMAVGLGGGMAWIGTRLLRGR